MFKNTFLYQTIHCARRHKSICICSGLNAMLMMQINFISNSLADSVTLLLQKNFLFNHKLRLQLNFFHFNCHGCSFTKVNYEKRDCRCCLKGRGEKVVRDTKHIFPSRLELISQPHTIRL